MNVIDMKTRRPLGAPAPFVQHFEVVFPVQLRPRRTDIVSVIAVVRHDTGVGVLNLADELRAASIAARGRLRRVVALADKRPLPGVSSEAYLPEVWFERAPAIGADAWELEVMLTCECASRLTSVLQRHGVGERVVHEDQAAG